MFKREMKVNFKKFMIWTGILLALFLLVFLIYPSIINDETIMMMDEMMKAFPKGILKSFNMDISSISSVYGWIKSEGFVFILLVIGTFSGIMGSNIILKEESDKTIEYLNTLPIKRKNIVISKALAGFIYIVLMTLVIGIFNYVCLSLSGDFNKHEFILLSVTPIFSSSVIYFLCMFLSAFTNKTKKMAGLSIAVVFISYLLNILSELSSKVEFLKYFSIFTLADIRNVIKNGLINPIMIIISMVLSILFFILTIIKYKRKDLV